jgi:hypothetical protein
MSGKITGSFPTTPPNTTQRKGGTHHMVTRSSSRSSTQPSETPIPTPMESEFDLQATPMPKGKGRERAQGEEHPSSSRAEASDDVHDTLRIIMEQLKEQNKQIQQMKDRDTQRHSPGYREEPESSYSRSPRRREHSRSP